MAQQALSGTRVIDLTQSFAGPYCTKLMAGFGADVVKVEPPGTGDCLRTAGPFYRNQQGIERSIPFLWLNTGKKGVTLDWRRPEGKRILTQLVREADVLVESEVPGVLADEGLDYDSLRRENPRLVVTSITNFGQTGPYRGYAAEEITLYAMCGAMHLTGASEREPLAPGPATTQYTAAMHGYMGTLMALLHRGQTGEGQHVDVSMQESGIEAIEMTVIAQLRDGANPRRAKHPMVPWDLYRCKDGWAAVICGPFRHWNEGAAMFEEPRLLADKYYHVKGRMPERDQVEALIQPWIDRHTRREIFEAGQKAKLAFSYLASLDEVLESPQHRSRGFFAKVEHPEVGEHEYCSHPFKMSETPWTDGRAPLLGEHNDLVYGALPGLGKPELARLRAEGVI